MRLNLLMKAVTSTAERNINFNFNFKCYIIKKTHQVTATCITLTKKSPKKASEKMDKKHITMFKWNTLNLVFPHYVLRTIEGTFS